MPTNTDEDRVPNADTVARWMVDEVTSAGILDQYNAIDHIQRKFGEQFVYINNVGNPAIDKMVLRRFNQLTAATVVWSSNERYWRLRSRFDPPGRMQE